MSFRDRERHAETLLSQFRIDAEEHRIQIIAEYAHLTGFNQNCSSCQPLIWPGESVCHWSNKTFVCLNLGTIPVDTERSEIRRVVLSIAEIAVITIACVLGLVLASVFLTFNVIYRHERYVRAELICISFSFTKFSYIKLSSPKLNNVMVIGAMHIYIAILLFAFDQCFLQYNLLGHACMVIEFLFRSLDRKYFSFLDNLVTNFLVLWWFLADVRFDVSQNSPCLSDLHFARSTPVTFESSLKQLVCAGNLLHSSFRL